MAKTTIILTLGFLQLVVGARVPSTCVFNTPTPPPKDYEVAAREQHNFYRAKHQSPGLTLHDQLNAQAQQCAEFYASKGTLDAVTVCPYKNGTGENQYATWYQRGQKEPSCTSLANSASTFWYNTAENYDYRQPGYSPQTGAFTQFIWKGSKNLGMGCSLKNGFAVIVALYSPPGNLLTHGNDPNYLFRQNVLPPLRRAKQLKQLQLSTFAYFD